MTKKDILEAMMDQLVASSPISDEANLVVMPQNLFYNTTFSNISIHYDKLDEKGMITELFYKTLTIVLNRK